MAALKTPYAGFVYRPHQIEGVAWMMQRETIGAQYGLGGILADEMGLGKTWTTIGLFLNAPVPHTLLVVPPTLEDQWMDALRRAGITHVRVGPKGARTDVYVGTVPDMCVTVSTYVRATNNVAVRTGPWDRLVLDEGHLVRNPATKMAKELTETSATRRWILTGTPVQNKVGDFVGLLRVLHMDAATMYMRPSDIAPHMILRRTIPDVSEDLGDAMPAKPVHVVHGVKFPEGGEESVVFNTLVGRFKQLLETGADITAILELYMRIQQFLAHPAIYVAGMREKHGATYPRTQWTDTASKFTAFCEFIATTAKEPTLVFCHFRKEMDMITVALETLGYAVSSVRGGMTREQRSAAVAESAAGAAAGRPVAMVVQIVAGNAGLNLQHCNRVVFYSSHWNPCVVDQAVARAYRMGQQQTVTVHHFLVADGVQRNLDRLMAAAHGRKRDIALSVHPKLYCESAIAPEKVLTTLDDVAGPPEAAAHAAAQHGSL
jgi:SNF2 family DNA or RNA helicase